MWRLLWIVLLVPMFSSAQSTEMQWLDNRFRVDPTIKQVSFLKKKKKSSQAVTIVRPDGTKYYAWDHPENVSWYEENEMDIISIENPMPGPWQAIGKISAKNKVKILSELSLDVDPLPKKLYQSESIKFTAQLLQNGQPLVLRDFLNRVKLNVTFTPYRANGKDLPEEARPIAEVLGSFDDDGQNLDEVAGDGVFTVNLPIDIRPGKYLVKIQSGNGVFLRTTEQDVLVYPTPVRVNFIQSRNGKVSHSINVDTERGAIKPGSLAATIEQIAPDDTLIITQSHTKQDESKLSFDLPNNTLPGTHTWSGWVFGTDLAASRPLSFRLGNRNYGVTAPVDLKAAYQKRLEDEAEIRRIEAQIQLEKERDEARKWFWIFVFAGNIIIIVVILMAVLGWKKMKGPKKKKASSTKLQKLSMPPS